MADNMQYQDDQGELDVPEQPLEDDYDTPAAPPEEDDDDTHKLPKDHPALDSNLDDAQVYDEGVTNASEANAQYEDDEGEGIVP